MSEHVHKKSAQCLNPTLDLFAVPPTKASVEEGYWVEFQPLAAITPLNLNLPSQVVVLSILIYLTCI